MLREVVVPSITQQINALEQWREEELGVQREEHVPLPVHLAEQSLAELVQVYLGELLDAKRWSGVLGMGRVKVAEGLQADKEYLSEFFGKEEVLGQRLARAQTHLDRMQSVADLLQVDAADFVGMVHARFGEDARGRRGRKLALRVLAVRKDPERQQLEHAVNG